MIEGSDPISSVTCEELREVLLPQISHGQPKIVIDLQRIPLIDSKGLELLVDISDHCQARGGSLHLAAPNALCSDILRITGVATRVSVYEDLQEAIRSYCK